VLTGIEDHGDIEAVGRPDGMCDLQGSVHGPSSTAVRTHVLSPVYRGLEQRQATRRQTGLPAVQVEMCDKIFTFESFINFVIF